MSETIAKGPEGLVTDLELAQMLEELDQAKPRRGRPLEAQLERELTAEDLLPDTSCQTPDSGLDRISAGSSLVSRIRHSHHQIARLMAEGRKQVEISALLGYSPSWLSSLKTDPAFRELLEFYSAQQTEILADLTERQKAIGLAALEELQDRLDTDPEGFGNRELMELVETNVNKPAARAAGFVGSATSLPSINISFVTPEPRQLPPASGPTIEGEIV